MSNSKLDKHSIIKLLYLVLIFTLITIVGIKIGPWLFEHGRDPEYIRSYLAGFGNAGFLIYMLIQAIHVMIVVIPGDIFNICGGFVYGIPLGFVLSLTGLMIGSVIVFYISRIFGYEIMSKLISEEKIEKISGILNSTRGTIGMFIICCIPLIPKDIMMYIAGLTPVKASRLFLVYALSRVPSTLIWVSIGANAFEKDIRGLVITVAVMLIMFVVIFFIGRYYNKREKIFHSKKRTVNYKRIK